MDQQRLWLKISGSITYYLKSYSSRLSDDELWEDYLNYALHDYDGNGVRTYLDKQTFENIVVSEEIIAKAKVAFYERLKKRRLTEAPKVEEPKKDKKPSGNKIIDISKFKKK